MSAIDTQPAGAEWWRVDVRVDGLLLTEVVEHLDPPDLRAVGPVLLGRLAPRRMLVTCLPSCMRVR